VTLAFGFGFGFEWNFLFCFCFVFVFVQRPFKGHKLTSLPSNSTITTKEEVMEFYRQMSYYRRFEIVADTMYKQRLIRG